MVHIQQTDRMFTEHRLHLHGWGLRPTSGSAGAAATAARHVDTRRLMCHCHCVHVPLGALTPTPRKEPGKLPLGVERPRPMDLDAVARVLADAVHGGGAARQWRGPGRGAGGRPREPAGSSEDGGTWGGDGLRGEPLPQPGGQRWPSVGGPPACPLGRVLSAWDVGFVPATLPVNFLNGLS